MSTGTKDVVLIVADAQVQEGTLRARIVDSSGHTLEDVELTLWRTGGREGHFLEFDSSTGAVEPSAQPGRYRIQIGRGGRALFTSAEFTLEESKVTELGDLTFGPAGRVEVRIAGLPTDASRLDVSLEARDRFASGKLEWQDGVWRSQDLAAGRWMVSARGKGFCVRGSEFEVVSGTTVQIELKAEPAVPVELTFSNPGTGDVTIEARDGEDRLLACDRVGLDPDKRGTSHFTIFLPAGQASVEVRTLEGLAGKADIDVNASLHTPVVIALR